MIDFGNVYAEKMRLREVEAPKTYDYLPPTFLIKTRNPLNFIPMRLVKHFNERIYANFLHRECFNACLDNENDNQCYLNCQNKHLTSIELFKRAVEENRRWEPINSYVNLREYQKRPNELGKNVVSDSNYSLKHKDLQSKFKDGITHETNALDEVFAGQNIKETPSSSNVFGKDVNWGHVTEKDFAETD